MKISELNLGQGNVDAEGTIKEMGEVRTFNKFGRDLRVSNAILEDSSGTVKLTLWNDDTVKFKEGDKIKVINGYVNEFQGEKQLTSGKFGKIEKLEEGDFGQAKLSSADSEESEFKDSEVEDTAEALDESETYEDVPEKEPLEDEENEAAEEDEAAEKSSEESEEDQEDY